MSYPRQGLKGRDRSEVEEACGDLSFELIDKAVAHMDSEAEGGISASGTVIMALVVRCHDLWLEQQRDRCL